MQTGGSKTRSILVFCTVLGVMVSGAVLLAMTALQDSPECATHQAMDRSMPLQSRLQSIIDTSADEGERTCLLREEGSVGVAVLKYLENKDRFLQREFPNHIDTYHFENFVNYQVLKTESSTSDLTSDQFRHRQQNIRQRNQEFQIYDQRHPVTNYIDFLALFTQGDQEKNSEILSMQLRHTLPYYEDHLHFYKLILGLATEHVLDREMAYWRSYLSGEICSKSDKKRDCVEKLESKIEELLGNKEKNPFQSKRDVHVDLVCNLKIVEGAALLELRVCGK